MFLKNNKTLEHLNVLLRIFFVSGVFQNFDVDFWPLLKAEKVFARSNFSGKFFFLKIFIFFHLFESINFQPAGFLAFKEKSGPLLQPYFHSLSMPLPFTLSLYIPYISLSLSLLSIILFGVSNGRFRPCYL